MPTMIVLAGPNGAGKSTLYANVVAPFFNGPFINADIIQRDEMGDPSPEASYRAAEIATSRRAQCLHDRLDFATETVFSHPSKVSLVREAKANGFKVWVMHVGVAVADISVSRVSDRIDEGGHSVPESKIRERFDRSAPLILAAVHMADYGLVFDNSRINTDPRHCLTFHLGRLVHVAGDLPTWITGLYIPDFAI